MKVTNKWAKKWIGICLSASMLFLSSDPSLAASSDIEGHWAKDRIEKWTQQGWIKGYEDGTFKPNQTITRAEFITLVNKVFQFEDKASISFADVSAGDWFHEEIAKAQAAGYIKGYEDGTIRPKHSISRQEAAAILSQLKSLKADQEAAKMYKDVPSIPAWSKGAIGAVAAKGWMKGYPDQTFQPKKPITRAEAVVTLDGVKADKQIQSITYDKPGVYGSDKDHQIIEGDVTISVPGVTLQNMTINGSLTFGEGIGDGEAVLKNVTVKGTTVVRGGGLNTVVFQDSMLEGVTIDRKDGKVRVLASGKTKVKEVKLKSGAKLEEKDLSDSGFGLVVISQEGSSQQTVTIIGNVDKVDVQVPNVTINVLSGQISELSIAKTAANATVNLSSGTTVKSLTADAAAQIKGSGKIESAQVNVNGVQFEKAPDKLEKAENVTVTTPSTTPSSEGGGGGGEDDTDPDKDAVNAAKAALDETTIKKNNADLNNVVLNLTLPTQGASGTTIRWTSSHEAVDAVTGAVYRPDTQDVDVTLTATISKGSVTDTKVFSLKVKAKVAKLELSSSANSLKAGQQAVLAGYMTASDLYGLELHFTFDPSKFAVVKQKQDDEDVDVKSSKSLMVPIYNKADYEKGTIVYAETLLGDVPGKNVNRAETFTIIIKAKQDIDDVVAELKLDSKSSILLTSPGERFTINQ